MYKFLFTILILVMTVFICISSYNKKDINKIPEQANLFDKIKSFISCKPKLNDCNKDISRIQASLNECNKSISPQKNIVTEIKSFFTCPADLEKCYLKKSNLIKSLDDCKRSTQAPTKAPILIVPRTTTFSIDDLPLCRYPFIGSNNAASYLAQIVPVNSFTYPKINQRHDLHTQYVYGVRYFNLKNFTCASIQKDTYYEQFSNGSFEKFLLAVLYNKEVIVINFDNKDMINIFKTYLKEKLKYCLEITITHKYRLNISIKALKEAEIYIIFMYNDINLFTPIKPPSCFPYQLYKFSCINKDYIGMEDNMAWYGMINYINDFYKNYLDSLIKPYTYTLNVFPFLWEVLSDMKIYDSIIASNLLSVPEYYIYAQSVYIEEISNLNKFVFNYITSKKLLPNVSLFNNISNFRTLKLYLQEEGNKQVNDPNSVFYYVVRGMYIYRKISVDSTTGVVSVFLNK